MGEADGEAGVALCSVFAVEVEALFDEEFCVFAAEVEFEFSFAGADWTGFTGFAGWTGEVAEGALGELLAVELAVFEFVLSVVVGRVAVPLAAIALSSFGGL